jgi:putative phosphoesterase
MLGMVLQVGIISDTHGLLRPRALTALEGCGLILHAGDVGRPEIIEQLREVAPVEIVRGNVDHGDWARNLPKTIRLSLESVELFMHHGHVSRAERAFKNAKVVVQGHSHRPAIKEKNGVLRINPGSAGPRRFSLPVTLVRMQIDGEKANAELIDLRDERSRSADS